MRTTIKVTKLAFFCPQEGKKIKKHMKNIMRLLTRTKCHNKAYPIPTQSMVLNLVPRKFSTSINMTINPYLLLQSKIYPVKFNVNTFQAFILYLEKKLLKYN